MRGLIFRRIFQLCALQDYSPRHGSRIVRGGTKEAFTAFASSAETKIGLTSCIWLTQSVLNRVIRRAIVPCLKGRIRRGGSRPLSAGANPLPIRARVIPAARGRHGPLHRGASGAAPCRRA